MKTLKIFCGCYNPSKILLRNITVTSNRCKIFRYPKLVGNRALKDPSHELTLEEKILNTLKGKLIYNSLVSQKNLYVRWRVRAEQLVKMNQKKELPYVSPVSLRYMYDESDVQKCVEEDELSDDEIVDEECSDDDEYLDDEFHLPYSRAEKVHVEDEAIKESTMMQKEELLAYQDICPKPIQGRRWMSDYECFDEEISDETPYDSTEVDYGTPDPRVPPSNVPCGGCGAHLHCQNPSIPGYLPQELYKKCKKKDLMSLICQRCTFLKNYNTALKVNVDVESYPRMLAKLRETNALVILMVDMTDFPCSIWPKLLETIGENKPLIVVGNKIDLLPGDSPGWLEKAKQSLIAELPKKAKIIHVGFISAKTGFGVEELINKLFSLWGNNGDVYLVGCTNVGKSSLFNALLRSDYCKSTAIDLVQRAVTSPWPGTTLNLLKFPITKINAWRSFLRTNRLVSKKINENRERKLAKIQAKLENAKLSVLPSIIGTINTTFKKPPESTDLSVMPESEFFVMRTPKKYELKKDTRPVFNPKDKIYQTSNWCFDTPGVVHEDQIINLLTTEEIMKLLPQTTIVPRVYSVRPEQTLFIGGVARLDLLHSDNKFVRIIIYASQFLPITLCETKHAEDVHEVLIGTSYMAVPRGSLKRLEQWPGLKYDKDFELKGQGFSLVSSEIVLSSTGWIGVSAPYDHTLVIRPWTPLARGIYLRKIPVLKLTTKLRKKRIANSPTYFMARI